LTLRVICIASLCFCIACSSTAPYTVGDTNSYQNSAAAARYGRNFTGTSYGKPSSLAAVMAVPVAICRAIDDAKNAKARTDKCKELLRTLDATNPPAYEWQSYFERCRR